MTCTRKDWLIKWSLPKMVSIEPIMDLDVDILTDWIKQIAPEFVSIGADSKYLVKIPEPSGDKVKALIQALKEFTEVKVKSNLSRLVRDIKERE